MTQLILGAAFECKVICCYLWVWWYHLQTLGRTEGQYFKLGFKVDLVWIHLGEMLWLYCLCWAGGTQPSRDEYLDITTQHLGLTTRFRSRNLAFYSPSIKHYPTAQNLNDSSCPGAMSCIYAPTEGPKKAGSWRQWHLSLPCTLGGCGLVLLSCSRACSLQSAAREVKSLWAEAGTECPLYMRAYQSGNSLECCTTELLPPCVCAAAQESVYTVSLSAYINNVKRQISKRTFFFFFLIGSVGRGRCLWLPSPP